MDKRVLFGCIAALAVLVVISLLTQLFGSALGWSLQTPLGILPVADVVGTLLATATGGWIARNSRFRWLALGLMAAVWVATLAVLGSLAGPRSPEPMRSLPAMLQYNGLAIVLTLGAAWLGAWLGEREAQRRSGLAAPPRAR
ncbi:MAG: hypothetical protein M3Q40_04825 [Pseudomonadota bacterium]|nr:hypothetical protein [Pseudomonadota bacterium]